MAQREPALVTPFWVRIATETSLSPGWLLIAFPAVLYPTYLALEVLFGRGLAAATDFGSDFEARMFPFWATSLGYVAMGLTYVARGTFFDLEALRPVLRGGEAEYADLQEQLTRFERRRLWIGGLVWLAVGCVSDELVAGRWTRLLAGDWSLRDPCLAAVLIATWIVFGWSAMYLIESSRLYSKIGERHVEVDLLDLGPLSHLTRHGLRVVLVVAIYLAVAMIVSIVGTPSWTSWRTVTSLLGCLLDVVVATVSFVLPVRGLRRHIRARKAEKLGQLRDEIRQKEELMAGSGTESVEAGAKLPGLFAYIHEIESVREWPFDAPTLTRVFVYAAIPLGSWVGGALVERLLGAALD
jgi:hypothetical protein